MIPSEYPNGQGGRKVNDNPQPDTWKPYFPVFDMPNFGTDMPSEYRDMIEGLLNVWRFKLTRNLLRYRYYNGKNVLKDFGISIPPSLRNVETVVGWPQKAVDAMAVRCRFDGFNSPDSEVQLMLDDVSTRSHLGAKFRQAAESTLIHSCCFATVNKDADGKPRIDFHSAESASAIWDDGNGRIGCGLVIDHFDHWKPDVITLYATEVVIRAWDTGAGYWDWNYAPIGMGRPTMVAFAYRPTFAKPFGQSRITRAVMSITDSAVREALRTEISAEFFTSPQKYLLGAPEDLFAPVPEDEDGDDGDEDAPHALPGMTKWEAYLGSILAVTRDEDGNVPTFGQIAAASMEPHIAYMRNLAARFSGATNVPISELGIVQDNPSSAEAIYAAKEALIIEAEDLNESNGAAMRNVARMALAIAGNKPLDALTREEDAVGTYFMNPSRPSLASQTDAMLKQASVFPGIVRTRVYWEELGYRDEQIDEIMAQMDRDAGSQVLQDVLRNAAGKASDEYRTEAGRG